MKLLAILVFFATGYAETNPLETVRVAIAGSSACETYHSGAPELIWGWGEVIGDYFKPGAEILNHAKGGRSRILHNAAASDMINVS